MTILPAQALSVRQPWAWAIVSGHKDIENRSAVAVSKGDMKPREICIHASKGMTQYEYDDAASFMRELGVDCPPPANLIRGAGKVPTACCEFAVVDIKIGQEVCRVWKEEDARLIALLLDVHFDESPCEQPVD